jgi:hypothetical protein
MTASRAAAFDEDCGPGGTPVKDPQVIARIRALVIPPAWEDVWICPQPGGHIQADLPAGSSTRRSLTLGIGVK